MTAIINPIGIPSIGLPTIEEIVSGGNDVPSPSVGGSYYLCINPAVFGSIDNVKAKSDDYVAAIENCQPRPGHSVRVPGAQGYQFINSDAHMVDVFTHHWDPFFVNIAGQDGLSEQQLREDFSHQ